MTAGKATKGHSGQELANDCAQNLKPLPIVPDPMLNISVASCCDLLKSTISCEFLRPEGFAMGMHYYNDGLASSLWVINDLLAITYKCCCDLERY